MQTASDRRWHGYPPVPPEEIQMVADLYRQDLSYAEIATRTGLTPGQIGHRVRLAGVQRDPDLSAFVGSLHQSPAIRPRRSVSPFGALLRRFRERQRVTRNALARQASVNPSHVTRIEHGDRNPPNSSIVEGLARALRLSDQERDQLMVAAGHKPLVLNGSGWCSALHEVATVLNDHHLSDDDREEFGRAIQTIARHWRRP